MSLLWFFAGLFFISCIIAGNVSVRIDKDLLRQSAFYGLAVTAAENDANCTCQKELMLIAKDVYIRKKWTIKLLDASGTPSHGLRRGSKFWLGSQSQCEESMVLKNLLLSRAIGPLSEETVEDLPPFPVAYYVAYFTHNSDIQIITHSKNEFMITFGLCLPTSCGSSYVKYLLQKYFDSNIFIHQNIYNATYRVDEVRKIDGDSTWLRNTSTIITGIAFSMVIIMCILGTLYDMYYYEPFLKQKHGLNSNGNGHGTLNGNDKIKNDISPHRNGSVGREQRIESNLPLSHKIIKCFSVYENVKNLIKLDYSSDNIPCIHGYRFFATIIVCFGHVSFFTKELVSNRLRFYNVDTFTLLLMQLTIFNVETSFCVGGYIMAYTFFKKVYKISNGNVTFGESLQLFLFYVVKRFFRLAPTYIMVIGLNLVMSHYRWSKSPFVLDFPDNENCAKYWWRNIFFIHNVRPQSEMCMLWSWYFSNDMQYFVMITFLLVLSRKYFYTAAGMLITILIGSVIHTRNLVYSTKYIPLLDEMETKMEIFYHNPVVRIPPYIIGVCAAYFVYRRKDNFKLHPNLANLFWIMSPLANIYFSIRFVKHDMDLGISVFYMMYSKITWALAIAWGIIAHETGNKGFVGDLLSWKYYSPFTKIAYVVQLINPIIIYFFAAQFEFAAEYNLYYMAVVAIGYIVVIYAFAIFLAVLIEIPSNNLIKTVMNHNRQKLKTN